MNVREKNLLALKVRACVERRDRGRQRPGSTETMNASLPDDLTLRIFGFCSAKCLLTAEVASRALRDLRWHKTNDAHWCGLLRARWPREGPALCSLRQRATARQLFRAFATKRDARTQIMRRPERVVDTDDSDEEEKFRIWGEDQANDDPDRLVFLVCVGRFAGLASWMQVPADAPYSIALKPGLAWKPTDAETSFDIEIPQDVHMLSRAQIIERYGNELAQTVHVIDMETHKCVTLVEDVVPCSMNIYTRNDDAFPYSHVGDVMTRSSHLEFRSFRHNFMRDVDERYLEELYESLEGSGYTSIEHCVLCPFLTLRPSDGQLRMHRAELEWVHVYSEYMTVRTELALREYLADTIEQTHEEGWQRVPLREPLTALANNRRDRTEELPGAVDADLLDARAERARWVLMSM